MTAAASDPAGAAPPAWAPYDALLLVSFGGPEKPEDVVPFLQNVTTGKNIPVARLEEVGEHYYSFGGKSPINDQNRALIAEVEKDLAAQGIDVPVYWGNRNWDPYFTDALRQMAADGVQRAACWVTSAYSSYSGCRQYRENLAAAVEEVPGAPQLDRLRHYYNHPGFLAANLDATLAALEELAAKAGDDVARAARLVFVTHSIPTAMDEASGRSEVEGLTGGAYVAQHRSLAVEVVAGVAERTGRTHDHDLVYCSRSGPPQMPWLVPDVNEHLELVAGAGVPGVVVVPIGFVSDHMEVIYDL
ncbi:MAG: ferrochelatase, partial [Nocardioides sp.]|nr:ferrochelatase [Nocardioides sp.]